MKAEAATLYLLMVNGRPACWTDTRAQAEAIADMLRTRERERRGKGGSDYDYAMYGEVQYSTVGVTDNPYGDPHADTIEKAISTRLGVLEGFVEGVLALLKKPNELRGPLWKLLKEIR